MFLDVKGISVSYGETRVINDLSMECGDDEILGILGRNGMGKTTLLKSIMGVLEIDDGEIHFQGENISTHSSQQRARSGISLVPQSQDIFPELTVEENLQTGEFISSGRGISREDIYGYFPILEDRLQQKGGSMSGGEQQMLSIARGLLTNPDLLLLDEPSEGIQPSTVRELGSLLPRIQSENDLAIILVEQNLELALSASERAYVMQSGNLVHEGPIDELYEDGILEEMIGV